MGRSLVTYFSITGFTENIAILLAEAISADLFEITAEHRNVENLSDGERQEEAAKALSFTHKNIECYDRIYVGLPVWWYAAPTVIHNFLAAYDLTGKTIIPFATSGGGGLDKIRPRLLSSCPGADLKEASLLPENMSKQQLKAWAETI